MVMAFNKDFLGLNGTGYALTRDMSKAKSIEGRSIATRPILTAVIFIFVMTATIPVLIMPHCGEIDTEHK